MHLAKAKRLTVASDSLDNGDMNMTSTERAALADRVKVSDAYLYQCLTGRKAMNPEEAVRIERESDRAVMRWDLRRDDWHRIWPELIGQAGAPEVAAQAVA